MDKSNHTKVKRRIIKKKKKKTINKVIQKCTSSKTIPMPINTENYIETNK